MTGVWNRAAIVDNLQRSLPRSAQENFPIGVIVADLDHFKRINDTFGHAAGDTVLQEAACRMKGALRSDDNMGRYGGEEFLITTSGSDRSQTMALAESIRGAVNLMPVISEAGEIAITVSLGVAMNDSKCEDAGPPYRRCRRSALSGKKGRPQPG